MKDEINEIIKMMSDAKFGHLPDAHCTSEKPMQMEDRYSFRWHHEGSVKLHDFFNLEKRKCPHCQYVFTCQPESQ